MKQKNKGVQMPTMLSLETGMPLDYEVSGQLPAYKFHFPQLNRLFTKHIADTGSAQK
jgi:hypothetical protein